jgi:hypothetical protein
MWCANNNRQTWSFWDHYCDEAYCIISPDFLSGGATPAGLDLEALKRDLALLAGGGGSS